MFENLNDTSVKNPKVTEDPIYRNDFYQPLNEMDPFVRPTKEFDYKFGCGLFDMGDESHNILYTDIINKCLNGTYVQGLKQTHFTPTGTMLIYLEWMEKVKVAATAVAASDTKPEDKKSTEEPKEELETKKTKKRKSKKEHFSTEPTLPFDLMGDPAGLASLETLAEDESASNVSESYTTKV